MLLFGILEFKGARGKKNQAADACRQKPLSGAHRSLLIGCNYVGTPNELHGCANDVRRMIPVLETCLKDRNGVALKLQLPPLEDYKKDLFQCPEGWTFPFRLRCQRFGPWVMPSFKPAGIRRSLAFRRMTRTKRCGNSESWRWFACVARFG